MFLLLQWAAAAFLLIFLGITLKKLRKPRAMVTGLCLILCIASVLSGIVLAAVPMPAEEVSIEALGEKNPASSGSEVALRTVVVDGRETPVELDALQVPSRGFCGGQLVLFKRQQSVYVAG